MKLIRFGEPGREKPGVELPDGTRLDLSAHIADYTPEFFAAGGVERLAELVKLRRDCPVITPGIRLGAPVARPHKFLAIGLNYVKHAQEAGMPVPKEPVVFTKHTSCISGPNDAIPVPRGSTKLDYEVELAFVMKNRVRYLEKESEALQHVAGYLICNDISERDFQFRSTQWTLGKSHDGFGPLGPWLVTPDEVGDPHNLDVELKVNGKGRQKSNTADFIFNINHCIWYLSQFMTLEPGDVVTTGTPFGVALGLKDPAAWLKDGDTMDVTISKLGTQRQVVKKQG
ncbi:MAG: fumarylacetoacetate hydrolase family protein [Deltaproteobacteria bacterium]|nr:fumarylacetoacetate hydrolase family protein [Deltaproteobacteria bacterium]